MPNTAHQMQKYSLLVRAPDFVQSISKIEIILNGTYCEWLEELMNRGFKTTENEVKTSKIALYIDTRH